MKKILVLALMMMASISYGQKFTLSFDAQLAVPQGDYKDITPEAGYGLRADVLFRPKKSKFIKFGLDLGLLETNRTTQYFSAYVYGFYEDYKISATSNVVSLMFLARFQPDYFHKVKPFVDLIGGYNIFFSTASIERLTYYSSYNNSYSNSTKSHWAFSYGTAGGADIPLNRTGELGLELKVAYIIGAYTTYLTNPYISNTADVSFTEKNSRTNMLIPQAGIRISL